MCAQQSQYKGAVPLWGSLKTDGGSGDAVLGCAKEDNSFWCIFTQSTSRYSTVQVSLRHLDGL